MIHEQQLAHLQALRISPIVSSYLDQEIFRSDQYPDYYDTQQILNDCYSIVQDELKEMGINFVDETEVLCNYQDAQQMVVIYAATHPETVSQYMPCMCRTLHDDLESFINDEYVAEDGLYRYIQILHKYCPHEDLENLLLWLPTNVTVEDYFKDNVDFVMDIKVIQDASPEQLCEIMSYIHKHDVYMKNMWDTWLHLHRNHDELGLSDDVQAVSELIRKYEDDIRSNWTLYAFVDKDDKDISPYQLEHAHNTMLRHREHQYYYQEYWDEHPSECITDSEMVMIVLHLFREGRDVNVTKLHQAISSWKHSGILQIANIYGNDRFSKMCKSAMMLWGLD